MGISSNKWLNLIIFFVVVFIATSLALMLLSFKRNKNGVLKATFDIANATVTTAPTQPNLPGGQPGQPNQPGY